MSISRLILDTTKIQLSNCAEIHEYCGKYQEAYDAACSLIGKNCELPTKGAAMLLQASLLTGMGDEYSGVVSTMESEWKEGETNLADSILRLIRLQISRKKMQRLSAQLLPKFFSPPIL